MDGELVQAGRAERAAARWEYSTGWKPLAPETTAAIEAALAGSQTTAGTVQHRQWIRKCQRRALSLFTRSNRAARRHDRLGRDDLDEYRDWPCAQAAAV